MSHFKLTVLICLCFQLTIILSHSTTDPLRSGNWSFCWRMHTGWLYAPFFWAGRKEGGHWFIYLDLISSCILLTLTLFSNEAWRCSWAEFINACFCCEMIYFCLALISCPLEFTCIPEEEQWMDVSCSRLVKAYLKNLSLGVEVKLLKYPPFPRKGVLCGFWQL